MPRRANWFAALIVTLLIALAGCSSSGPSSDKKTSSAGATRSTSPASPSASRASRSKPSPAGVAVTLDPCDVVTQAEASKMAGTQLTAGQKEDTNGGKRCTYGAGTKNVFFVQVSQAKDPATAQAAWDQYESEAQTAVNKQLPAGVNARLALQPISGLGDKAAAASMSSSIAGQNLKFSGIYLLKGAVFLAFGDLALNAPAPAKNDMQDQATTSLGRLP